MPWTLDRVLWHLDNLAPFALLPACFLRQRSVHRCERVEHRLIEGGVIGVDSRGVLTQVVETGKGFATVARERPFASVFSA